MKTYLILFMMVITIKLVADPSDIPQCPTGDVEWWADAGSGKEYGDCGSVAIPNASAEFTDDLEKRGVTPLWQVTPRSTF